MLNTSFSNKIQLKIKKCNLIFLNTSFFNKTQLKIKNIFFIYWVGPGSMHLAMDRTDKH